MEENANTGVLIRSCREAFNARLLGGYRPHKNSASEKKKDLERAEVAIIII